jgi:hypothetical protein
MAKHGAKSFTIAHQRNSSSSGGAEIKESALNEDGVVVISRHRRRVSASGRA